MQNDNFNGMESPNKMRTSIPFNAQLEITKIGSNSSQKGKFTPQKQGKNLKSQMLGGKGGPGGYLNVDRQLQPTTRSTNNLDITVNQVGAHIQSHL